MRAAGCRGCGRGEEPESPVGAKLQRSRLTQTQLTGIADDSQSQCRLLVPLPVGHHLPALTIQTAKALQASQHYRPLFPVVLMQLGDCRLCCEQKKKGSHKSQKRQQDCSHEHVSVPGILSQSVCVAQIAQIAIALR